MKIKESHCKYIEDILPLYLENEVHPETRDFISRHLEGCPACRGLIIELSGQPVNSIEDIENMPDSKENFHALLMRLKKISFAFISILLITMLGIGVMGYYAGKTQRDPITYVQTEEDVIKYYYDTIPGLKRAQREGNYQNITRTIVLPTGLGSLHFDKIWYTRENIYVFYHLESTDHLGKAEDIQLSGSMMWDTLYDGEPITSSSFSGGMDIDEWVSYQGRYYKVIGFPNNKERFSPSKGQTVENLNLTLDLTYIPSSTDNLLIRRQESLELSSISFPVLYDGEKEKTYTLNIDKRMDLGSGASLIFHQLVMEPQKSYLFFDFSPPQGKSLGFFKGTLTTDEKEEKTLWLTPVAEEGNPQRYRMELEAIDHIPQDIDISLDELRLITSEVLTFDIPVKIFHGDFTEKGKLKEIQQPIGKAGKTQYTLEQYYWDERGLSFTLVYDAHNPQSSGVSNTTNLLNSWPLQQDYKKRLAEEGQEWDEGNQEPNLVKLINEKGQVGTMEDHGQRGSGPGMRMSMFISKKFIEDSDTIRVEIYNPVEYIYGSWTTNK